MTRLIEMLNNPSADNLKRIKSLVVGDNLSLVELEAEVINLGNAKLIFEIAKSIDGINIGRLAHEICKTKDFIYIYRFASEIAGAPIEELAHGMIKTKNVIYIYYFARNIKGAPIRKLTEAMIKYAKTKIDATYLCYFIRDVKEIPEDLKSVLVRKVISFKDATSINQVAVYTDLGGVTVDEYIDGLIGATKDSSYGVSIYLFAKNYANRGADLDILADALIEAKDYIRIKDMVKNVEDAPIEKLIDALIVLMDDENMLCSMLVDLAVCQTSCSAYATYKLIQISNIEWFKIAIKYVKDKDLLSMLNEVLDNKEKIIGQNIDISRKRQKKHKKHA